MYYVVNGCTDERQCAAMCRHLEWDHDEHSVVLKSTHHKAQRSSQLDQYPLMALAILSVWPLQFTALIEIHKKVVQLL